MTNAHIALQTLHMASFKYIAHQPVRFTQTEAVIGIYGDDAGGIPDRDAEAPLRHHKSTG